uniref:Uncharacterized protein n=1 Tax=Oryza brachyantha TaxID=4533 RepID=J3MUH5_ORYBR
MSSKSYSFLSDYQITEKNFKVELWHITIRIPIGPNMPERIIFFLFWLAFV